MDGNESTPAIGKKARLILGAKKCYAAFIRGLFVLLKWSKLILGNFSYQAPDWVKRCLAPESWLRTKTATLVPRIVSVHRQYKKAAIASYGVAAFALMGWGGWYYYTYHMPHPEWTTFSVSRISPRYLYNPESKPNPLVISFSRSVADLKLIDTEVSDAGTISPSVKGKWKFEGESQLSFYPEKEWTPGQEYTFVLNKKIFASHVIIADLKSSFTTTKFEVQRGHSEFNQHPTIPKEKKGVFTIRFNYPVDPTTLSDLVSVRLIDKKKNSKDIKYSIQFDEQRSSASIHTEFIAIPEYDALLELKVKAGVRAEIGGNKHDSEISDNVEVPGMYNYFKISDISPHVIRNEKYEPEHVLIVTTSTGARTSEVAKSLSAFVLPKINPWSRDKSTHWSSSGEVRDEVLKQMEPLPLEAIPSEFENSTQHTFKLKADVGRWMYVKINKGLKSFGEYVLASTYTDVIKVPKFSKELLIMHEGSILSMDGEKKIPVLSRNIDAIRFEVRRMRPNELHHFISQSSGQFQTPHFANSWSFSEDNITETFFDERKVDNTDPTKTNYLSFDFSQYINSKVSTGARGIFFFKAQEWDVARKRVLSQQSSRFIILTDLGVILKKNIAGELKVYVQSFKRGTPIAGAKVNIMALNGTSIFSETTDSQGAVSFPPIANFTGEKRALAVTVTYDEDYTFLPLGNSYQNLSLDRFDISGIRSSGETDRLQSFAFTDRGIYRPGDTVNIGVITKNLSWSPIAKGVPLELVIVNPKGVTVKAEQFSVDDGLAEFSYSTKEESPTGGYNIQVYVIRNKQRNTLVGSADFKVEEFLPDRMKILATLSKGGPVGWVKADKLTAKVSLTNLIGTPAQNRRVESEFRLTPSFPNIQKFSDYYFINPKVGKESYSERLEKMETNDEGEVEVELNFAKFDGGSYRLDYLAEGFEPEGGRSVSTSVHVYVSPLEYVVGYRADGELYYMKQDIIRKIELLAVNHKLEPILVKKLKTRLIEYKNVSVLTRQSNGTYKYQSVRKEVPVGSDAPLAIDAKGSSVILDTSKEGSFELQVLDGDNVIYASVGYSVIAPSGLARGLDRNAELQIVLDKNDYKKGDEIELQIKAPYVGAGLITVEREKVFASSWFKTTTETSVQRIRIPDEVEGNAYISVVFLRSLDSKEIYTSPMSYGVVPFTISKKSRQTEIALKVTDLARPGEKLKIKYSASRPTSLVLYGVDEGILQVAGYKLPDPLSFFLKKRALQVETSQILDLLLPEYSIFRSLMPVGGDEGSVPLSMNLNPFKRRRDKPVAFWSGVIKADETVREYDYEVPDYFNGSMKIMAVAASEAAVGADEVKTTLRNELVLMPNVPMFVAPGDEFEVSVGVTNTAVGSGVAKGIKLNLEVSEHLEVVGTKSKELEIKEGSEKTEKFLLKAKNILGSASIKFTATWNGKNAKSLTDLSLRPSMPYKVDLKMGHLSSTKGEILLGRKMYDEYSSFKLSASVLPLTISQALLQYLDGYPHGCTEQTLSKSFPTLLLAGYPAFGVSMEKAKKSFEITLQTLRIRQTPEGGFGLWDGQRDSFDFVTLYGLHYLTEAKEKGYGAGDDLLKRGLEYLKAGDFYKADNMHEARLWAYSLYLQARNGVVVTKSLETLKVLLEKTHKDYWRRDLTGVYMAGAYALLQKNEEGEKILKAYVRNGKGDFNWNFFYEPSIRETQYLYIVGRHYPAIAKGLSEDELLQMLEPILKGSYTSINSSYAILGLDAYVKANDQADTYLIEDVKFHEVWKEGKELIRLNGKLIFNANFTKRADSILIENPKKHKLFYQASQSGFEREVPKKVIQNGLEIVREYLDENDKPIAKVTNGNEVWVRVRGRTIKDIGTINNVAIVDLLPGGFEVVRESISRESSDANYIDIREDRVVIYRSIYSANFEFKYKIKATNAGKYVVPPPFMESMYDRTLWAQGLADKMVVE